MISKSRQEEIRRLSKEGLTRREIADRFDIEPDSVRRYLWQPKIVEKVRVPKVLLLDIETLMMRVYVWGLYKQQIPPDNVIDDWCCLGWSAKWLFSADIMSDILTPDEALKKDDSRLVKGIWNLMEESDIIIGHNLKRFDNRKLNARFIMNGLKPPLPYQMIDTLTETKKRFAFSSYTLKFLCKQFGLANKIHTDYNLWKRCYAGDKEALKEMEVYNRQDVVALEDLYVYERSWITSHPNLSVYVDTDIPICPNCGSADIHEAGDYGAGVGRYIAWRCNECGAIGRGKFSVFEKEKNRKLIRSVAR